MAELTLQVISQYFNEQKSSQDDPYLRRKFTHLFYLTDKLAKDVNNDPFFVTTNDPEIQKVIDTAVMVFGSLKKASFWLTSPTFMSIGEGIPIEIIKTKEGREEVLNILGAIEYGHYT